MAKKTYEAEISVEDIFVETEEGTVIEVETPAEVPVVPAESVYTAEELAENYKIFNTSHAIVAVALRLAGKKSATLTEAKDIINKFKNKEVK